MHFHFICLARAKLSIMKSPFSSINFFPPTVICSMLLLHDNLQRFSMQYMLSQASMNWMASFLSPVIILIVKFGKDKKRFVCKFDVLFSLVIILQLHVKQVSGCKTYAYVTRWGYIIPLLEVFWVQGLSWKLHLISAGIPQEKISKTC